MIALHPFGKGKGAGSDRLGRQIGGGFGRDDHRIAPGHLERKRPVRGRKGDPQGCRINHLDRGDPGKERLLRIGAVIGARSIEREFHILGVEGAAIVKDRARAQMERVGGAVFGHIPAFGQGRQHRTVGAKPGQALEDVGIDDLVDCCGRAGGRVKVWRLQHHAKRDRVWRSGGGPSGQHACGGGRHQAVQHLRLLLLADGR